MEQGQEYEVLPDEVTSKNPSLTKAARQSERTETSTWLGSEVFAVICRGRTKLYYELDLVQKEGAGLVQLVRGDVVRIVEGRDTSIVNDVATGNHSIETTTFTISGITPLDGEELPIDFDQEAKELRDYFDDHKVSPVDVVDGNQSTVVMLTRYDLPHTILEEVYILPIQRLPIGQSVVPLPGDHFDFTRLEAVPSVVTGLIAPQIFARFKTAEQRAALLASLPDRSSLPLLGPMINLYRCASEKMHTSRVEPYPTEIPIPGYQAAVR
jgi:hypothetical protein